MAASKRSKLAGITNPTMIELEKSIAMFEDRLAEEELVPKSHNVFEKVQAVAAKMSFFKEFFISEFCFWGFSISYLQSLAGQVDLCIPSGSLNISVIYQPKWLKFGVQAHFLKMFGHTKFQLSISCAFKVVKLLVMYLVISNKSFITLKVQETES